MTSCKNYQYTRPVTTPSGGPQPARTDRPREAALRVLRELVAADGPATLAMLTQSLGGHPNTTRMQLEHLVADGWATQFSEQPVGRGRPAKAYLPTVVGRQAALQDPDLSDQVALLEAVAEHLSQSNDPRGAALAVGRGWGRRLAAAGSDELTQVLGAQGFTPEAVTDGIALRTCPLLGSAKAWPTVVCGIHQGLVDEITRDQWLVEPFALAAGCLVRRTNSRAPLT